MQELQISVNFVIVNKVALFLLTAIEIADQIKWKGNKTNGWCPKLLNLCYFSVKVNSQNKNCLKVYNILARQIEVSICISFILIK